MSNFVPLASLSAASAVWFWCLFSAPILVALCASVAFAYVAYSADRDFAEREKK